jgi:hypothetical protein
VSAGSAGVKQAGGKTAVNIQPKAFETQRNGGGGKAFAADRKNREIGTSGDRDIGRSEHRDIKNLTTKDTKEHKGGLITELELESGRTP